MACVRDGQLLEMYAEHGESYNTVNLCTTFHRLAKQLNGGGPFVPMKSQWRNGGGELLSLGCCCTLVGSVWHRIGMP